MNRARTKGTCSARRRRLPPKLETTIFRLIQEAIGNIARHAEAKKASITLYSNKNAVGFHIRDDGRGFDVKEALSTKDWPRGLGLLGMKERVELINGTWRIRSHPSGGGTEIDVEIPMGEVSSG